MGFSLSWIALKGASRGEALAALELRGTGAMEEVPESPLTGAALSSGWYLVVDNRRGAPVPFMKATTMRRLSQSREVVTCFVEERVMCSLAQLWRNGEEVWWIEHEARRGDPFHLETKGTLPECFDGVRERLFAEQRRGNFKEVDFVFDVPVEVAREITGYRHDDWGDEAPVKEFEVLETIAVAKGSNKSGGGWLRRIFGG